MECRGSGTPVVLLEAGLGSGHEAWSRVEPKIARQTRTCAYDRAGIGRSGDRRASPVPIDEPVHELHALLHAADVDPPYVYVGHSVGGIYALAFMRSFPTAVAGAVYVDGTPPSFADLLGDGRGVVRFAGPSGPVTAKLGGRPAIYLAANNSGSGYGEAEGVEAVGSGHSIQDDRPALVIEAVREVVDAVRDHEQLPPCRDSRLPRAGGRCE
jgi:pimeloyl-ACP methyl ester carboxylesterase